MKYTKTINLDVNKPFYEVLHAKQNDNARYLLFNLLNNGVPFVLTDKTVRAYAIKPDNTEIYNDLTIINAINGQAELQLTSQMLAVVGMISVELVIFEGTDILSTVKFVIEVTGNLRNDDAIESTNEFSALLNALAAVDNLEVNYAPRLTIVESSLSETATEIEVLQTGKASNSALETTNVNVTNGLAGKVDIGGNEQVSWGMIDQHAKEQITGDKTAVVGEDSVNTSNLVNNSATFIKRSRLGDLPQVQLTGNLPNITDNSIVFDNTFRVVIGKKRYEVVNGVVLDYSSLIGSVTQIMIYFNTADLSFHVIAPTSLSSITENHVLFGILGFSSVLGLRDILLPTDYMVNGYNPGRYYDQLLKDDLLRGTTTSITWHTNNTPRSIIYKNKNGEVVRVDEFSTVGNTIIEKRSMPNVLTVTLTHNLDTLETEVN